MATWTADYDHTHHAPMPELRTSGRAAERDEAGRTIMRAIVCPLGFSFRTVLDRVVVGRGSREGCQALADELNVSDEKCNALLNIFRK